MKKAMFALALLLLVGTMMVGTMTTSTACVGCGWCTVFLGGWECYNCCGTECPNQISYECCIDHCDPFAP